MLGRVFQDPMMGTAAGMQIEENMAMANRRGKKRGLSWGITKKEKEMFKEKLQMLDLGLEDRMTSKSRTIIRRSETGIDTAYGNTEETKPAIIRRTHSSP